RARPGSLVRVAPIAGARPLPDAGGGLLPVRLRRPSRRRRDRGAGGERRPRDPGRPQALPVAARASGRVRPRWDNRTVRADDILGAIGNTPLVGIQRVSPTPGVRLWA